MGADKEIIRSGMQQALEQYMQKDANAQPVRGTGGSNILNAAISGSATGNQVMIFGSDDGGTTARVINTDASGNLQVDLNAGENFIGSVGGKTNIVSSTITMSVAGAYASGDYMGTTTTPQAFTNAMRVSGGTGVVKSITISDKITSTNVAMELWLFSATFVAPTDNAAWAISDAENLTVLGVIPIETSKWYASGNNQVYDDDTLSKPVKSATRDIFYALVARGVTPAFTSQDLTVTLGILQD